MNKKNICIVIVLSVLSIFAKFNINPIKTLKHDVKKLPIVYHKNYNINTWGIPVGHSFDPQKYGKIVVYLKSHTDLTINHFYKPTKIEDQELLKVHPKDYLESLKSSSVVARIIEMPFIGILPNFIVQRLLLNPMRYATRGTLVATRLAQQYGWAINLSGGYHHACADHGGGFCIFADIPLAGLDYLEKHPDHKVMIIDLDAHQGNGHEDITKDDEHFVIFDVYGKNNYPFAREHERLKDAIKYNFPLELYDNQGQKRVTDNLYLDLLEKELPKAIKKERPDFIIYNAGTDIYEEDPLGQMKITKEGIISRDELVFVLAKEHNIPIVMVLSGGYTKESASVIGESIVNLIAKMENEK